jgi:hypothetical protein
MRAYNCVFPRECNLQYLIDRVILMGFFKIRFSVIKTLPRGRSGQNLNSKLIISTVKTKPHFLITWSTNKPF